MDPRTLNRTTQTKLVSFFACLSLLVVYMFCYQVAINVAFVSSYYYYKTGLNFAPAYASELLLCAFVFFQACHASSVSAADSQPEPDESVDHDSILEQLF